MSKIFESLFIDFQISVLILAYEYRRNEKTHNS